MVVEEAQEKASRYVLNICVTLRDSELDLFRLCKAVLRPVFRRELEVLL